MSENQNIYKLKEGNNLNMLPGDLKRSPDESFSSKDTFVFIDEAFLSKLSKYFGQGKYIKFDRSLFAKIISKKQNLSCRKIFLYTAPPFQSNNPSKDDVKRKEGYDKFAKKLQMNEIILREGRCQRLNVDNKIVFKQKYVDVLITIDLMKVPIKYKNIEKIILVSSDSDFVPAINALKEFDIKVLLFTYYEKGRKSNFSRSNELIKSVYKYVKLTKDDLNIENKNPEVTKCLHS